MKLFSVFTKMYQPILLITMVTILMADITAVASHKPQPITEVNKNHSSDAQLPPEVFPKETANDSIPHHLQGELPPLRFPDESTHAILTTMSSSKSDLKKKEFVKDTEHDETETAVKSNKTPTNNKTSKVASEVPDLLKEYMNRTVYEDGTENPLNNDTETVQGPNVVNDNKTHEEDVTKSSTEKQSEISHNETTKEPITTEENVTVTVVSTKSTAADDHVDEKNVSTTISPTELGTNSTDTDDKQNVTQSSTVHEEGTESLVNVTAEESIHNENETEIVETKNLENETTTVENNASIPITDKTTIIPISKTESVDVKDQGTADNKTTDKKDPEALTPLGTNTTILPSLKVESTTSVNISENLIDHKADSLVAPQHGDHSHATSGKSSAFLQPTESAAILAGVFVGIALLGYVGLLIWRRVLEKRYGNREMLVNEDDFYDTNDLRNFEL